MGIRLLAFDLDGTVLHSDRTISQRTRKALQNTAKAGTVIVPATGRSLTSLPKELFAIPEIRYLIIGNGSFVYDTEEKRVVHQDCFSREDADAVFSEVEARSLWAVVYIRGQSYIDEDVLLHPGNYFIPKKMMGFLKEFHLPMQGLVPTIRKQGGAEKIELPLVNPIVWYRLWRKLERTGRYKLTSSIPGHMEINSRTGTKGHALKILADHLNIPLGETAAFGDGSNDVELLRTAGVGVAMKNAIRKARAASDQVTLSNDRDGVADWIERHLL